MGTGLGTGLREIPDWQIRADARSPLPQSWWKDRSPLPHIISLKMRIRIMTRCPTGSNTETLAILTKQEPMIQMGMDFPTTARASSGRKQPFMTWWRTGAHPLLHPLALPMPIHPRSNKRSRATRSDSSNLKPVTIPMAPPSTLQICRVRRTGTTSPTGRSME